jgi:hypothetical protein
MAARRSASRRRAAGQVGAVEALGDDALQPLRARGGQQRGPLVGERRHRLPRRAGEAEAVEQPAALGVGGRAEQPAVQPQQVEEEVGDGPPSRADARPGAHAPLQRLEVQPALGVEGDDLAVEHGAVARQGRAQAGELRDQPVMSTPWRLRRRTCPAAAWARAR